MRTTGSVKPAMGFHQKNSCEIIILRNMDTNEKIGLGGNALIPRAAFENPEYSYSMPAYQTACGAFDIFNHVLDNYYLAGDATFDMVLEMQEAVMRAVVKWAPVAMKEPENYEVRANLMWASSMALNSILDAGTVHGCACHAMEHELSAYYDITHGLAILTPRWLAYILKMGHLLKYNVCGWLICGEWKLADVVV